MKRLSLILALALAVPGRAAVVEFSTTRAAFPELPASAIIATPGLSAGPLGLTASAGSESPSSAPELVAAPAAARAETSSAKASSAEDLRSLFAGLDAEFPLPEGSPAAQVRVRVRAQLLSAARELADPEHDLLGTVAREADRALARIQLRLDAGEIDPNRTVRLSESDPEPEDGAHARIGVYPVAADPFQWGHLLIALRAVGDLGLDKVVFVLAGDQTNKPNMTPVDPRHSMGRDVLAVFAPFFTYSPIAVGTNLDGETNIFRILALNPDRRVDAWYMVGDDHYRLVDKNGNPDTLPKLERNFASEMGHSPTLHALKVAFIKREQPADEVPTSLEVRFLDHVGFDASSTDVRGGRHSLMPFAAYDFARRNAGLYGIPPAPEEAAQDGD
jgi:hypothetical protein